jgi:UDP-N-acetylglucosamine 3-dehydrogenase
MAPPPEGRLRVGIAGLGTMGRNHLRNLLARDDVTLVGVADPSAPALAAALASADRDVRGYADATELLAEEHLDALIVAAPTTLHFPVAMAALGRGVAVLVEKPLAATLDEGRQLVDAAEASGTLLMVGHIERFNPAVQALAQRLHDGALSRIFSVKTTRGGPLPERIRDVGVAIDLASHDLDIMCHLLGERPARAYAEASRMVHTAHEDLLYGLLAFPSGVVGLMDVNWLTPEKQRRIVVLGQEGMFRVDYLSQRLTYTRGAAKLSPTYLDGYAPMFAGETVTLPVKPAEPLRRELDAFFAAVRSDGPSPVSGRDGLAALQLVNLLLASAAEGRPVAVPAEEVS